MEILLGIYSIALCVLFYLIIQNINERKQLQQDLIKIKKELQDIDVVKQDISLFRTEIESAISDLIKDVDKRLSEK